MIKIARKKWFLEKSDPLPDDFIVVVDDLDSARLDSVAASISSVHLFNDHPAVTTMAATNEQQMDEEQQQKQQNEEVIIEEEEKKDENVVEEEEKMEADEDTNAMAKANEEKMLEGDQQDQSVSEEPVVSSQTSTTGIFLLFSRKFFVL